MAGFEELFREGKELFEKKHLRGALEKLEAAQAEDQAHEEVKKLVNSCRFDMNKYNDHFESGRKDLENGDMVRAYDHFVEMVKLLAPDEMTQQEIAFAKTVDHKAKMQVLLESAGYQLRSDLERALATVDNFLGKHPEDNELQPFAEQIREELPKIEARSRARTLVLSVGLPVLMLLVILIAYSVFRSGQAQQQREADRMELMSYMAEAFVAIPAGEFEMGSENGEDDERPVHTVTLEAFEMQATEMPQRIWELVMGNNPAYNTERSDVPVEMVSWNDVQRFLNELNAIDTTYIYRLPTEAEWEYACRAGTTTPYYNGYTLADLEDIAWFGQDLEAKTYPIALNTPNRFGLYDMLGNVWEWCIDSYHDSYNGAPTDGSAVTDPTDLKVIRGGSVRSGQNDCRCASRSGVEPGTVAADLGFRIVRTAK